MLLLKMWIPRLRTLIQIQFEFQSVCPCQKLFQTALFSYQHCEGGVAELLRNGLVMVRLLERVQGPHGVLEQSKRIGK